MNKRLQQFNLRLDQLLGIQPEALTPPGNSTERAALETARLLHSLNFNTEITPKGIFVLKPFSQRRTLMQTLRAKPALMILFVLLALVLLTGVAYAVGRSLGYIPGVGMVEQGSAIRILAEPVSLTRDGITLSVTEAVLTSDKTVVMFTLENVPWDALSHNENVGGCSGRVDLRLPDGITLELTGGEGSMSQTRFIYPPIPADVNEATFVMPCLSETLPGLAPENWELLLRFVPAPPDITIAPVLEIVAPPPTPTTQPVVTLTQSDTFMGLSYHLESVQKTGRGYLFETSIRWDEGVYADNAVGTGAELTLTDAAGQEIELSRVNSEKYMWSADPRRTLLGNSMTDVPFSSPLTLTLPWMSANLPQDNRPQFTFDPGPNPQPGQEWQINQSIEVLGLPVELLSARYITRADLADQEWVRFAPDEAYGFEISLRAGPEFRAISLSIDSGFSLGGGTVGIHSVEQDENGIIKAYTLMGGNIIAPLLISVQYVDIQHNWKITFDPGQLAQESTIPSDSAKLEASLQIEQVIPTDDGYYLIGRTIWNDPRFSILTLGNWGTRLLAPDGTEIPIESVYLDEIGIQDAQQDQWGYRVFGKVLPDSLSLIMNNASVWLVQPYTFSFQPGLDMQEGQEWVLNQPLEMLGYTVNVQKARYMIQGDGHGFEFNMQTNDPIVDVGLGIQSGVKNNNMSGGGGTPRDESGNLSAITTTGGQFTGEPVVLSIYSLTLDGEWKTTWNPPAAPAGATPFYVPQACVTLEKWEQVEGSPLEIPSELTGKLLLMRGALSPDPTLFISNLDGSGEIPLAFGHGTLSPDGQQVAYSDENNQLTLMDVASKKKTILGAGYLAPHWSPDGAKIAFQRETAKGFNIFIMDSDGKNLRALTDTTEFFSLSGWSGDGQSLLIQSGARIELLNVNDGSRKLLIETQNNSYGSPSAALSADGQWLAYLEKVPGKSDPGLFLSRINGTDKRLLIQLEHWPVLLPVFSPDGKWLVFSALNGGDSYTSSALINLENCQLFPLPAVKGEPRQWITP